MHAIPQPSTRPRIRPWFRSLTLSALVGLALGACATGPTGTGSFDGVGRASDRGTIRVENWNFEDATVHVEANGERRRLGRVDSGTTRSFRLPHSVGSPSRYRLVAVLNVSRREIASVPVDHEGLPVEWNLRHDASTSLLTISESFRGRK